MTEANHVAEFTEAFHDGPSHRIANPIPQFFAVEVGCNKHGSAPGGALFHDVIKFVPIALRGRCSPQVVEEEHPRST